MFKKKQKEFFLAVGTAIIIGIFSSCYAKLYEIVTQINLRLLHDHVEFIWILVPFSFLVSWWLVYAFCKQAGGSGIPQVMACLKIFRKNEDHSLSSMLSIRVIVVKIASSICYAIGGGAVGREGPTIQVGASIFEILNVQCKKRWGVHFSRSTVILAGAASGIAAAFNTPLGGIVYAIEELSSDAFHNFRSIILICVMFAGLTSQSILGPYLFIGLPVLKGLTFSAFIWAFFIGVLGGLGGSFFGWCLFQCGAIRSRISSHFGLALWSLICGVIFVCLVLYVNKKSMGSGRDVLLELFFKKQEVADVSLIVGRFFGPILTYSAGGAGGVFAPILAIGGCVASWISQWVPGSDAHLCVLLGMASFLTGLTHAPFTSLILVVEMTDRHSAIFPLMIAALLAQWTAKILSNASFYEKISFFWISAEETVKVDHVTSIANTSK